MNKIEYNQEYPKDNREHKSAVFCKVFSNEKDLLELYNALNDTDYQDPEDLEINTLENIIYISMKNDVSFLIDYSLNLYEQQSTFNPNMPLRGLMYFAQQYNKYVTMNDLNLFGTSLKKIPTPQYIVFYNGKQKEPERKTLRLSDAFVNTAYKGCLECEATMININYGHNQQIMEKCQKLKEYSIFVDTARKYTLQDPRNTRRAISKAVEECIERNVLRDLLVSQKAEVLETMVWTFNKELYEKELREEAIAAGKAEGRAEGRTEGRKDLLTAQVRKKLEKKKSVQEIAEALEESIEVIQTIIDELK